MKYETIYEHFVEYSIEEIDKAIENLSLKAKQVLFKKYGSDLKKPTAINKLSKEDTYYFGNYVLPKIRNQLGMQTKKYTIYDYFPEYFHFEIDNIIETIPDTAKGLLIKKYGSDLNKPIYGTLTKEEIRYFSGCLLREMRRKLERIEKTKTIYDYFLSFPKQQVNEALKILSEKERELINKRYGLNLENTSYTKLSKNEQAYLKHYVLEHIYEILIDKLKIEDNSTNFVLKFTKSDYLLILKIIKKHIALNILEILTYEELIISILKMSFNFPTLIIAKLFNISEDLVLTICNKYIFFYKEFNFSLDKTFKK